MNYQILVNKNYLIGKGFKVNNLKDASNYVSKSCDYTESDKPVMVEERALEAFKNLRNAALKDGYKIFIDSAYRSYGFQEKLFENCVRTMGKEAYSYCSIPGASEHQTGLALDLGYENNSEKYFWQVKENSNEFKWLLNNAYKYGFILRYPKGKELVTKVMFEPWHYRYVGEEFAKIIKEENITLDEYYERN